MVRYLPKREMNFIGDKTWKYKNQAKFFSSLAELLAIGFSISSALIFLKQTEPTLNEGIEMIQSGLSNGKSFSDSASMVINKETYYQLLIAEKHGNLISSFNEIAKFNALKLQQIEKIKSLLVYPIFLVSLLLVLMLGINVFIKPQIAAISATNQGSFGWKKLMLGVLLILILAGFWAFKFMHKENVIAKIDMIHKIPVVGKIYQNYTIYYLANNLAILLKNGLSLKEIIAVFKSFPIESLLYYLSFELEKVVSESGDIDSLVKKHSLMYSELFKLLSVGNKIDDLANNMLAYANLSFKKMVLKTNRLIGAIQPIMFLIIGLVIVLTYFQLLMPMYDSLKGI